MNGVKDRYIAKPGSNPRKQDRTAVAGVGASVTHEPEATVQGMRGNLIQAFGDRPSNITSPHLTPPPFTHLTSRGIYQKRGGGNPNICAP